ncbi:MAG: alpha/beta hydrolase [Thermomicrobiales bacterium]
MKRLLTLVLVLLLGVPTAVSVVAQPSSAPAGPDLSVAENTPVDCASLTVFGTGIVHPQAGETVCGTLQVPENWLQPEGRIISISYVILKSTSPNPEPDPVVYLEGGPGGTALAGIDFWASNFVKLRENRDIVLFDQRGAQFSSLLSCSAFTVDDILASNNTVALESDADVEETGDELVDLRPAFDIETIMAEARHRTGEQTAACVRELLQQGVDLRQYNSVANARDTIALMQALGYETFNLYGISYGTRLALVIMRDFPDSGVRSVVLDSTFPPEIKGFELYPSEAHEVMMQLFADCALDPVCGTAYPNLKQRFIALLEQLQAEPVTDADGISVEAVDVIMIMRQIPSMVQIAPYIPRLIEELENGETATFRLIVSGGVRSANEDHDEIGTDGELAEIPEEPVASPADEVTLGDNDGEPQSAPSIFFDAVASLALASPDSQRREITFLLASLTELPPTKESLETFVQNAFADPIYEPVQAPLLAFVHDLSEEDVQEIFATVAANVSQLQSLVIGVSSPLFNSVECNEEIPFEDFSTTVANTQALEIPEIAFDVPFGIAGQFAQCEQWPSGRALDIENKSVTSDIPTLILAGTYDFQTPVSWNKQAFVNLPNAYYSEFPMAGHGVINFSDCAKDITRQFVDDPSVEPINSCKADLKPQWVLPDVPLPGEATPGA